MARFHTSNHKSRMGVKPPHSCPGVSIVVFTGAAEARWAASKQPFFRAFLQANFARKSRNQPPHSWSNTSARQPRWWTPLPCLTGCLRAIACNSFTWLGIVLFFHVFLRELSQGNSNEQFRRAKPCPKFTQHLFDTLLCSS